jgi:undecaprenyl-diphosphatase
MNGHVPEPVLAVQAGRFSGRPHRGALVAGLAVALVCLVTLGVLAHRVPWFPLDLAITRHVQDMRAVWIGDLLRPFNRLGFPPIVGIVDGAIVLLALAVRARWEAVTLGFAAVGSSGLNHLAKVLVARPRPPELLVHVEHVLPAGSSFPAGHVLNFTVFAGFLCYLAWVRLAPSALRTTLVALLVAMIALMGVARIHAGEHWASDVLGGYLIGVLWLAATIELYRWGRRRSRPRNPSPAH